MEKAVAKKEIPRIFYECFSLCNSSHIEQCSCHDDEIRKATDEFYEKNVADLTEQQKKDKNVLDQTKMLSYNQAIKSIGKQLAIKNVRCPLQVKYYSEFLSTFDETYDVEDRRVVEILSSLFRMFIKLKIYYEKTQNQEPLLVTYDKHGNKIYQANPVETMILNYEKTRIDVLEKLDRIINGQKSVVGIIDFKDEMINIYKHKQENIERNQKTLEDRKEVD